MNSVGRPKSLSEDNPSLREPPRRLTQDPFGRFPTDARISDGLARDHGGAVFEVSQNIARHFLSDEYADPVLSKMASESFSIMDDSERRKSVAKVIDYATDNAYLFAMLPNDHALTHSKDVRLINPGVIRATRVSMHEFAWK